MHTSSTNDDQQTDSIVLFAPFPDDLIHVWEKHKAQKIKKKIRVVYFSVRLHF
jgi:hypothetical protein